MGDFEICLLGQMESSMKHHSFKIFLLTPPSVLYELEISENIELRGRGTVSGGQFKWGACLPNSNGGV